MEAGSAIVLALVLLAGGGAAGAAVMSDVGDWTGQGMMGDGRGMMDGDHDDCPYHEDVDGGECARNVDVDVEECDGASAEDCPYEDGGGYRRGGGCCD
jgi:hypothetical protein